jgi:rRNA maturation endonuclease Nob1
MNWNFVCADCHQTFEAEAVDELDQQECPDCGELCTPFYKVDECPDNDMK